MDVVNEMSNDLCIATSYGNGTDEKRYACNIKVTGENVGIAGIHFYATNDEADGICHKLSKQMPGVRVAIEQACRIRAVYKDGVRIEHTPMSEFYIMTKDELKTYEIRNSRYGVNYDTSLFSF
jgi:hypothetical protein